MRGMAALAACESAQRTRVLGRCGFCWPSETKTSVFAREEYVFSVDEKAHLSFVLNQLQRFLIVSRAVRFFFA